MDLQNTKKKEKESVHDQRKIVHKNFFPLQTLRSYLQVVGGTWIINKANFILQEYLSNKSNEHIFYLYCRIRDSVALRYEIKKGYAFGSELRIPDEAYYEKLYDAFDRDLSYIPAPLLFDYACGIPLEKNTEYGKTRNDFFSQEDIVIKSGTIYANNITNTFFQDAIEKFSEKHRISIPLLRDIGALSFLNLLPCSFFIEFFIKKNIDLLSTPLTHCFTFLQDNKKGALSSLSEAAALTNALLTLSSLLEMNRDTHACLEYGKSLVAALNLSSEKNYEKLCSMFYLFRWISYYFEERINYPEAIKFFETNDILQRIAHSFRRGFYRKLNRSNQEKLKKNPNASIKTIYSYRNDQEYLNYLSTEILEFVDDDEKNNPLYEYLASCYPEAPKNNQGFSPTLVKLLFDDIREAYILLKREEYCHFGKEYFNNAPNNLFALFRAIQMGMFYYRAIDKNKIDATLFFNFFSNNTNNKAKPHFSDTYRVLLISFFQENPIVKEIFTALSPLRLNRYLVEQWLEATTHQYCDRGHDLFEQHCSFCEQALHYNTVTIQHKIQQINRTMKVFFGEEQGYASLQECIPDNNEGIIFNKETGIQLTVEYRKKNKISQLHGPLCLETFSETMTGYCNRIQFFIDFLKNITNGISMLQREKDDEKLAILTNFLQEELKELHRLFDCFSGKNLEEYRKEFLLIDESAPHLEGALSNIFYETGLERISLPTMTLYSYFKERINGLHEKIASFDRLRKTVERETNKSCFFYNDFKESPNDTLDSHLLRSIKEAFLEKKINSTLLATILQKKEDAVQKEKERLENIVTLDWFQEVTTHIETLLNTFQHKNIDEELFLQQVAHENDHHKASTNPPVDHTLNISDKNDQKEDADELFIKKNQRKRENAKENFSEDESNKQGPEQDNEDRYSESSVVEQALGEVQQQQCTQNDSEKLKNNSNQFIPKEKYQKIENDRSDGSYIIVNQNQFTESNVEESKNNQSFDVTSEINKKYTHSELPQNNNRENQEIENNSAGSSLDHNALTQNNVEELNKRNPASDSTPRFQEITVHSETPPNTPQHKNINYETSLQQVPHEDDNNKTPTNHSIDNEISISDKNDQQIEKEPDLNKHLPEKKNHIPLKYWLVFSISGISMATIGYVVTKNTYTRSSLVAFFKKYNEKYKEKI